MSYKKGLKNYVYDDYDEDFYDYDNYDEENYSEFEGEKEPVSKANKKGKNVQKNETAKNVKNVNVKKEPKKKDMKEEPIKKGSHNKETVQMQKELVHKEQKVESKEKTIISITNKKESKYVMLSSLNIIVLGHTDAGKSTLLGALLYNLYYVNEQVVKKYEKIKESYKYTYILDEEEEERNRNITLFNKRKEFFIYYTEEELTKAYMENYQQKETNGKNKNCQVDEECCSLIDKCVFDEFYKGEINTVKKNTKENNQNNIVALRKVNIFDTPGHSELINNLYSCSFFADCAILLIDANNIYNKKNDQTYKDISILKSVGIYNIIVIVNKMDLFNYDSKVYDEVCTTVRSFFECNKNDSIFEFLFNNHSYVYANNKFENKHNSKFERKLVFVPLSAYKNKNIVKFEKSSTPLFNAHSCLFSEIKYMNLYKDLFKFRMCEEIILEKKEMWKKYYNFIKNNNLFANNTIYNSYNENSTNEILEFVKSRNEDRLFIGVIHDSVESNNLVKASVKIISGLFKIKNDYTMLPVKEKSPIKKVETSNMNHHKFINIDDLCEYLIEQANLTDVRKLLSINQQEENSLEKEKKSSQHWNHGDSSINDAKNAIALLTKLVTFCSEGDKTFITNDIIDNVVLNVDPSKLVNGSVLVPSKIIQENKKKNEKEVLHILNKNFFVSSKFKVLIKMNELQMPAIIGRQYMLYSLNFAQSITIKNINYVYVQSNVKTEQTIKSDVIHNIQNHSSYNQIKNVNNYIKENKAIHEKMNNKKCLRSYDVGVIEIEISNNSLMCAQTYNDQLNYYISFDSTRFNMFDFFTSTISPLSRFILVDSSQIIGSGLILSEA